MTVSLLAMYATAASVAFGVPASVVVGVALLFCWLLAFLCGLHFLNSGHVNYYWFARGHAHKDAVDLRIAMEKLGMLIAHAEADAAPPTLAWLPIARKKYGALINLATIIIKTA